MNAGNLLPPERRIVRDIFLAGVEAADPYQAVLACLQFDGGQLSISRERWGHASRRSDDWRRVHLLALGKAAVAMARAALDVIPERLLAEPALAVTDYACIQPVANCQVMGAGHPLPDAAGLGAARQMAGRAEAAQAGELVLLLLSGGGSSMAPLPVDGVTLADKFSATQLLLACGASINEINCVRKHLSQFKGGGLARLAAPAALHTLILSDVIGDDVSAISSGPTAPDPTTFADAIEIARRYGIERRLPPAVLNYLTLGMAGGAPETPKPGAAVFAACEHTLVGGNAVSVAAAEQAALNLGWPARIYSRALRGEARRAARELAAQALSLASAEPGARLALIAGGETTVALGERFGVGGRNQELALAFALAAEELEFNRGWTFLSGGTDGRDGPTDAAGAIVDPSTLAGIRGAGIDPQRALDAHDAYPALRAADALLLTGATGTNVADLQILLLHPE